MTDTQALWQTRSPLTAISVEWEMTTTTLVVEQDVYEALDIQQPQTSNDIDIGIDLFGQNPMAGMRSDWNAGRLECRM